MEPSAGTITIIGAPGGTVKPPEAIASCTAQRPRNSKGPAWRGLCKLFLQSLGGRSLGGRLGSRGSRLSWRRRHTRLHVVGVDDGLGNVGGRIRVKHNRRALLCLGLVDHQRESLLLRIPGQDLIHLRSYGTEKLLHRLLEVALGILAKALRLLLLVFDGLGPAGLLCFAQLVALRLQSLGQTIDFVGRSEEHT